MLKPVTCMFVSRDAAFQRLTGYQTVSHKDNAKLFEVLRNFQIKVKTSFFVALASIAVVQSHSFGPLHAAFSSTKSN